MITIRDANEADLPAIVDIYNQSIPSGRATADTRPIAVADRVDWFRSFDPARRPIWVAEEGGRVVGCVYLSRFYHARPAYDKTAEISTYIATDHQRKGVGTLLKTKMIEACPRLGVENIVSMYFDHNKATDKVNQRLGFKVVGHLPEIAEVLGKKRGLKIALLRIGKERKGAAPASEPAADETEHTGRLDAQQHRDLALWAADCAEHVLPHFEQRHPDDGRPRQAIEAARAWARGEIEVGSARAAALEAHAAARSAAEPSARAAARAAGHAAAAGHVAEHARAAASYALNAAKAATGSDAAESDWQLERLPKRLWPVGLPAGSRE
jgi:phosphinothricin acetyltransferase